MLPDLSLVIRLQELDNRMSALLREIAALPKHIAEIEKKLGAHQRRLDADRSALSGNQKERKKLEGDVQIQEQKISKLKTQMLDAKTNDQYRAFQHEIDFCEKEIRKCEDRTLELMGESEPLDKNVKAAEASLKVEKQQVDAEKQLANERTAADKKELEALALERKEIAASITPIVLRTYDNMRKLRAGVGVAEALDGRCVACHITLRPQFIQDLKKGESVQRCESCGRILYYNPPESLDHLIDPGPATPLST